jgi:endonuclease/exonuclease/phosphatase family metal-dependent hydrolase
MTSLVSLNNTTSQMLNVAVDIVSDTPLQEGTHFWRGSTVIPPFERRMLFRFSRNRGIKRGKTYLFTQNISVEGNEEALLLKQRLVGTRFRSTMYHSIASEPWFDDGKGRHFSWSPGFPIRVDYRAFGTHALQVNHDLEYVFSQAEYPLPEGDQNRNILNLLSYNVYLRPPIFRNGQQVRAELLPDKLRGYDAIIFNEMFHPAYRSILLNGLASLPSGTEYQNQTPPLGNSGISNHVFGADSGVIIASRWPISTVRFRPFSTNRRLRFRRGYDAEGNLTCYGTDCRGDKGVVYATINKLGRRFHLFATHLQADSSGLDREARMNQIRTIKSFIDEQNIPSDELVIVGGDLNVNRASSSEYNQMLAELNATHPEVMGHRFTYDRVINRLAKDERSFLDYVLFSNQHRRPMSSHNEVRILRSDRPWRARLISDLSDHFAIYGRFEL